MAIPNISSDYGVEIKKLWTCIKVMQKSISTNDNTFVTVDTYADAETLASTLTFPKIIEVLADETQGGERATYYFNGSIIQEILLV